MVGERTKTILWNRYSNSTWGKVFYTNGKTCCPIYRQAFEGVYKNEGHYWSFFGEGTYWRKLTIQNHPNADVAIIELELRKLDIDGWFYENSLPSDNIYRGEYGGDLDIGRERELSFLGYPYVDLSDQKRFMPMSFNCRFSSELQYYKLTEDSTRIECDVLFLDRISIEGASGGGLYSGVRKNINFLDTGSTQLVGIISGNKTVERKQKISGSEQSIFESRLCFVMPTKYVWDLLR